VSLEIVGNPDEREKERDPARLPKGVPLVRRKGLALWFDFKATRAMAAERLNPPTAPSEPLF